MRIAKKFYIAAASLVVAVGAFVALNGTGSQAISSFRNCNDDAIIRCGALTQKELLKNYDANTGDVQSIYRHYGITRADIAGTASDIVHGTVYQDGRVVVNGKTVATGAYSVSRVRFTSQGVPRNVVINGKTYYEGPSMRIFTGPVDAFIYMRDGVFHKAILSSCANPLIATPTEKPKPKPVFACKDLTKTQISRTRFEFTGEASATNATIVSYSFDFGDGNSKVVTTGVTTASTTHDYAKAGTYTVKLTVTVRANGENKPVTSKSCIVNVTVEEAPKKPVFACEDLTATRINRTTFRFAAQASATNATIKSYTFNFGDGNSETVTTSAKTASTTHQYADRVANYTAKVTVTMSDGKTATNANCETPVKIEEKPIEPKPSVDIEKTVNGKEHLKVAVGTEFTYEIVVRNTGNVVLKDAVVTDKAPAQVTLLSSSEGQVSGNEWKHTIAELKVGESKRFTIRAKYAAYAAGTHKNTVCVDTPTVPGGPDDCDDATTETDEPIEVCDLNDNTVKTIQRSEFDASHMTTDLSKCGEIKVCIIEDKVVKVIAKKDYDETTMTTDLSKCDEVPVTPPELPKTGIEAIVGGGLGIGSIIAAGNYWFASRRNLLGALLDR